jgi:hypothetical protein
MLVSIFYESRLKIEISSATNCKMWLIFGIIEKLYVEGDEYVKEAATIGLLEGIQNITGNRRLDPEVFVQYLKPESAKWWKKLNDFWDGKTGRLSGRQNDA